jgi:hypothetical protein
VSTTILPTATNSLCQFSNDCNQKVDVVTNSTVLTARRLWATCSALYSRAPPRAGSTNDSANKSASAIPNELSYSASCHPPCRSGLGACP